MMELFEIMRIVIGIEIKIIKRRQTLYKQLKNLKSFFCFGTILCPLEKL